MTVAQEIAYWKGVAAKPQTPRDLSIFALAVAYGMERTLDLQKTPTEK
jgi:hypothetical protein